MNIPVMAWALARSKQFNVKAKGKWMREKLKAYRQGDVLLILRPAGSIPKTAVKLPHLTLAEGEVTGHAHKISEGQADLFDDAGKKFLRVVAAQGATLVHEEHGKHVLAPGDYEVIIQREYEPDGWRNVAD
jgi:hypothetical protein